MLGLIYEEEYQDKKKAADFYFLAAHLVPGDSALWKRTAYLFYDIGSLNHAAYCFKRCARDEDALFQRACCFISLQKYRSAIACLESLMKLHPENGHIARKLAKCYHHITDAVSSRRTLEKYIDNYWQRNAAVKTEDSSTLDLNAVNMLCELCIESDRFTECRELLKRVIGKMPSSDSLDLLTKQAVAEIHLADGDKDLAAKMSEMLRSEAYCEGGYMDLH
eukprot:Polyplicarium_translucidae@DN5293_c0_g1_i1.p1